MSWTGELFTYSGFVHGKNLIMALEFQGKMRCVIDLGSFSLIFDIPNSLQYQTELKTEFSLSCGDSCV